MVKLVGSLLLSRAYSANQVSVIEVVKSIQVLESSLACDNTSSKLNVNRQA